MPNMDGETPWGFVPLSVEGEITSDPTRPLPVKEDGGRLVSCGPMVLDSGAVTVHIPDGGPEIGWIRRTIAGGVTVRTPNGIEVSISAGEIWSAACRATGQNPDGTGALPHD